VTPKPHIKIGWSCLAGHVHDTSPEAETCIAETMRQQRSVDPFELEAPVVPIRSPHRVHEAGELEENGAQACRRCGFLILDAAPPDANRLLWGFGYGRRVAEIPRSGTFYLITPDRQLAHDEVPCR
jgi:hypothetical protein